MQSDQIGIQITDFGTTVQRIFPSQEPLRVVIIKLAERKGENPKYLIKRRTWPSVVAKVNAF